MCRENAALTQKQVADALNMERSTYAYYESGVSHPSGEMIIRLSNLFNVDYRMFMDAVGDLEFDKKPEDTNFTTFSDDSYEQREKLYALKKDEQNFLILYRTCEPEQREEVVNLLMSFHNQNRSSKKKPRAKK